METKSGNISCHKETEHIMTRGCVPAKPDSPSDVTQLRDLAPMYMM